MPRFRTTLSIAVLDGNETEFDLVIDYELIRGTPETGAGYLADPAAYDTGSPDDVSFKTIYLMRNGIAHVVPSLIQNLICDDEALKASLIAEAKEAA
ncbi:hypothetical protein [Pseudaminobacter salicylatoxidans]|uniref:hypothetical protein n=1 Tax=Pseudaminobacter salicylatoxidans TaxID=93369 RepID=UPI0002EF9BCD|nr:hypothetical protein [Pseudaminobacter salicylatoxidans]